MKFLLGICGFLVLSAPGVNGGARLTLAVSPAQSFAPSTVRIRARVEPSVENRALAVIADSGEFYRRSDIQLNGDRTPATIMFEFPSLPGGDYDVVAVLVDSAGRQRASARASLSVMAAGRLSEAPLSRMPRHVVRS